MGDLDIKTIRDAQEANMEETDTNDTNESRVTKTTITPEINISNLRLVTQHKYNTSVHYQTNLGSYSLSNITYSYTSNPYEAFLKVCNNISLSRDEEALFLYILPIIHGGLRSFLFFDPDIFFSKVPVNGLTLRLYWDSALCVTDDDKFILVPKNSQVSSAVYNYLLNKELK